MENFLGAERLREERARIGISQADAALLAGVHRNMWGTYERGISSPGANVLMLLIGHGFDVNYILGGSRTISETTLSDLETQLIESFRCTDDAGRTSLLRTAMLEAGRVSLEKKRR